MKDITGGLHNLAGLLEDFSRLGRPLERVDAAMYGHMLKRLLDDCVFTAAIGKHERAPTSKTIRRQREIALHARLRKELFGYGAGNDVAGLWGCALASVHKYSNKHRVYVDAWLERMERQVDYDRLGRTAFLRRELDAIELSILCERRMLDNNSKKLSNK